jgi:hypothetical protein
MKEYRCTRNRFYLKDPDPNDLTYRQGYYIEANSPEEALEKMAKQFPDKDDIEAGFTVDEFLDLDKLTPPVNPNQ